MSGIWVTLINVLILAGIIITAILSVTIKRMVGSVVALAGTGAFMGLEFIFLQAPDVAIAEVSVGAVLTTVLFIIALRYIHADREDAEQYVAHRENADSYEVKEDDYIR